MSYCKCGGYLGSGGVDGYAGRWCKCATPVQNNSEVMSKDECNHKYTDYNSEELHCFECGRTWQISDILDGLIAGKPLEELTYTIEGVWPLTYTKGKV